MNTRILAASFLLLCGAAAAFAQTSEFTYQGRLTDGGAPANSPPSYQMQFTLFASVVGGEPLGPAIQLDSVDVRNGVFTVELNFTAPDAFNGHARWLQIAVKKPTDHIFSVLTPRQPLTSTPYALRTLVANSADTLSSACTRCVTDAHIQAVGGGKVTGTVANATNASSAVNVTGVVQVANGGTGSATQNFVDLSSDQFSIGGYKAFTGAVSVTSGLGGPTTKLDVTGSGTVRARVNSDSNGGLSLALNDQSRWSIATVTGGGLQIYNDASGQLAMSINGTDSSVTVNTSISGNGSGLTNLNGANITDNTIDASAFAPGLTVPATTNSSLLGSLRWDLLGKRNFQNGSSTRYVAFDGANIWVTSTLQLIKLRASDGAVLGSFGGGANPQGVAFDGANIWVADFANNRVLKRRASDGFPLGTFDVVLNPIGLAFDGANIWVANFGSTGVTKLRASDGAFLSNFLVGSNPYEVAFDGASIWVANNGSGDVTKLRASDGANEGTFHVGGNPSGIAFDGANIWVSSGGGNYVTKLRASDGAILGTYGSGPSPTGVVFDGANIWVIYVDGDYVAKLRASDGVLQETFSVGHSPKGIAFDGANIWVTSTSKVTKIPAFP